MSHSSPPSSQNLKRKQQTISSFFTKKAVSTPATTIPSTTTRTSKNNNSNNNNSSKFKAAAASLGKGAINVEHVNNATNRLADGDDDGDDGDDDDNGDIVLPTRKRARANSDVDGVQNGGGFRRQLLNTSTADVGDAAQRSSPAHQSKDSPQFGLSRFVSSSLPEAVGERTNDDEDHAHKKEKENLHRKFVRKLGGAECLVGIGRNIRLDEELAGAGGVDDEGADGLEDEEEAGPKSRTSKKGGPRKLTPMEKQVIDIKRKHMDMVLVIEVGYKFRFFGEDARTASKELGIVCIPGKMRFDEHPSEAHLDRFASASIPTGRLHVHVKRLVMAGHKVGVVRQIETAALKAVGDNRNAPFVRKLTNVYTKGTYIDDLESLETTEPVSSTGYLLCITETNTKGSNNDEHVHVGIVAVQPTTGDVIYDDFEDGFMRGEVETRLLHIAPCELVIVGQLSNATDKLLHHISGSKNSVFGDKVRVERVSKGKTAGVEGHNHVSSFYAKRMEATGTAEDIRRTGLLEKVLQLPELVTICLSAMINHLEEYGLDHVFDLTKYFHSFSARSHMLVNGNTLTSLEIYHNQTDHTSKGSLFWTLDRTKTRFGQRLFRSWVGRPLLDKVRLEERVTAVEELLNREKATTVERLKSLLSRIKNDLEKTLIRIYYGKCTRPELVNMLQTLQLIANEFSHVQTPSDSGFDSTLLSRAVADLPMITKDVVYFLEKINLYAAKNDDKYTFFRDSEETDEMTEHKLGIGGVEHDLQEYRAVAASILGRKNIDYATSAGIEYLIEVDNNAPQFKRVPASWAKISGTKKLSRFHAPEVIKLLRQRDQHKESLSAACDKHFLALLAEISTKYQSFRDSIRSLATLDCLLSLAAIASQPGYVKPQYTDKTKIVVKQGRHPMVEQLLLDAYVPNDTNLSSDDTRALLVTGPNMGGKSSYVRQVALIAIMGQIGSYVPAQSATLGMLDAIFTRMGAFDNMLTGESTFMVELSETAEILKRATTQSLVILDELGRGTSTHDGVAIAQAVLDHMVRTIGGLTLFITHYQHLSNMARSFPNNQLRNVHMRFTESGTKEDETVTFLYEVGEGVAHRSYGLNVARLANLPQSVIDVAKRKSAELEDQIRQKRLVGVANTLKALIYQESGNSPLDAADTLIDKLMAVADQL